MRIWQDEHTTFLSILCNPYLPSHPNGASFLFDIIDLATSFPCNLKKEDVIDKLSSSIHTKALYVELDRILKGYKVVKQKLNETLELNGKTYSFPVSATPISMTSQHLHRQAWGLEIRKHIHENNDEWKLKIPSLLSTHGIVAVEMLLWMLVERDQAVLFDVEALIVSWLKTNTNNFAMADLYEPLMLLAIKKLHCFREFVLELIVKKEANLVFIGTVLNYCRYDAPYVIYELQEIIEENFDSIKHALHFI